MGIRGHIQTTQPSYENGCCVSSWIKDSIANFLVDNNVELWESEDNDSWEITIDDNLKCVVEILKNGKSEFNDYLPDDMLNKGYDKDLYNLLKNGIEVAEKKDYTTIRIDWF